MGTFILPGNQQMLKGDNIGKLNNLDQRVSALEHGGGGGTPASPSGSIQYNDAGAFGGSANATLDSNGNLTSKSATIVGINGTAGFTTGTNAPTVLSVLGGNGGGTSMSGTPGLGGPIVITGGVGGIVGAITGSDNSAIGGLVTIKGGTGGDAGGNAHAGAGGVTLIKGGTGGQGFVGYSGNGGDVQIVGGVAPNGGTDGEGDNGAGGNGGNVQISASNGGSAVGLSGGANGNGGNINITAGLGGTYSGLPAGTDGTINLNSPVVMSSSMSATSFNVTSGQFKNGNPVGNFANYQYTLGYNGTNLYRHSVSTRHSGGTDVGNAIDFMVWNSSATSNDNTALVTTPSMSIEPGKIAVGSTTTPDSNYRLTVNSSDQANTSFRNTSGLDLFIKLSNSTTDGAGFFGIRGSQGFFQQADTTSAFRFEYYGGGLGDVTARKFITEGGTSAKFVKGDGSLDSSTYLTTAVTSLTGTANQITASASTGAVTLSLPTSLKFNGQFPTADSTTAMRWFKADNSTVVMNLDTTNSRLGIGTVAPTGKLSIYSQKTGDSISDTGQTIDILAGGSNNALKGLTISVTGGASNYAIYSTAGKFYFSGTLDMNNNSILNAGNMALIAPKDSNYGNFKIADSTATFTAGNGGQITLWGNTNGQSNDGGRVVFGGIYGVKENSTYLNNLGALTFLTNSVVSGDNSQRTKSDLTERMRITSSGNVGIGTTTPSQTLTTYSTDTSSDNGIGLTNSLSTYTGRIWFGTPGNFDGYIKFWSNTSKPSQNTYAMAIVPYDVNFPNGGVEVPGYISTPNYSTSITGLGNTPVMWWTAGTTYSGTLRIGKNMVLGANDVYAVIGNPKFYYPGFNTTNTSAFGVHTSSITTPFFKVDNQGTTNILPYNSANVALLIKGGKSISTITFGGAGLNDANIGGAYTGSTVKTYVVKITTTGTPDKFDWSEDGGATWAGTNINVTTSGYDMSNGVRVAWNANTGHTLNNTWTITATPSETNDFVQIKNVGNTLLTKVDFAGNLGVRMGATALTAYLHLGAGTATASTAPLKFTSGTLLTAPEVGAVEFLTDAYYATITTGTTRKTFAFLESPTFTGTVTAPTIVSTATVRLKGYTVATLPAGTQGDTAYVTDALAPTFLAAIVGGGAVVTPVFYNGAAWVGY